MSKRNSFRLRLVAAFRRMNWSGLYFLVILSLVLFTDFVYAETVPGARRQVQNVTFSGIGSKEFMPIEKRKPRFVAGQFIVKFKDTLTEPADLIYSEGLSFVSATKSKGKELDQLIAKHKVR